MEAIDLIEKASARSTYASKQPEHWRQIVTLSCRIDERSGRIVRYVCRNQVDQFTEWTLTADGWIGRPLPKGVPCVLYA